MKNRSFVLAALIALLAYGAVAACRTPDSAPVEHKLGATNIPSYEKASLTALDATSATTIGAGFGGFDRYTLVTADCSIATGSGDASVPLDVYLQKLASTSPDVWVDYVHFPHQTMIPASATVTFNVASGVVSEFPVAVGTGADDATTPVLDSGIIALGYPGNSLRLVIVTGAGTIYSPASVVCYFSGR